MISRNLFSHYKKITDNQKNEFFWIFLGTFSQLLGGIFLIKYLTLWLNTADYGKLTLINSTYQFLFVIFLSSIIQGAGRYSNSTTQISHSFKKSRELSYVIIILLGLIYSFVSILSIYNNKINFIYVTYVFAIVVLEFEKENIIGVFHMHRIRKVVSSARLFDSILKILLLCFLFIFDFVILESVLFVFLIVCIFVIFYLKKNYNLVYKIENTYLSDNNIDAENKIKTKILNFAIPFATLSFFTWILNWMDRWILNYILTITEVGIYTANSQLANIPYSILSSVFLMFFGPIVYKKYENIIDKNDKFDFNSLITNILIIFILISIIYFINFYFWGNEIMKFLLSNSFLLDKGSFSIISIGWFFFHLTQIFISLYVYCLKEFKTLIYSSLFSSIIYFILIIYLVSIYRIQGCTYAFLISNIVRLFLILIILNFRSQQKEI